MPVFFAPLYATVFFAIASPCPPACGIRPAPAIMAPIGPSIAQERALRRRVIRLARIKMFERRQAMLYAFLAKTHTESPLFEDVAVRTIGPGVQIGPTIVTRDFLGSPIVRALVRNIGVSRTALLLTVHLRTATGAETSASVALGPLAPGAARPVELESPSASTPVSLRWSMAAW